jgi:hypothetical protein
LDTNQSAPLRLTPIASKSYTLGRKTVCFHGFPFLRMSKSSMENLGEEKLMSYAEDFHARILASPQTQVEEVSELQGSDQGCGVKWGESFAKLDQDTFLWKTHQCLLAGGLEPFCETWPEWGMMQNGECFARPIPAWITSGKGFSYMPTITKTQIIEPLEPQTKINSKGRIRKIAKTGTEGSISWALWVLLHGLNPMPKAAEYFMGWPMEWTALQPLGMDKFQMWYRSHGKL